MENRVYKFQLINENLAYMIKEHYGYYYLYIRKEERAIVTKTNKVWTLYDYEEKGNTIIGKTMLELETFIINKYQLYLIQ